MIFAIPSSAKSGTIAYVRSRQGRDGGYLFYQYDNIFESAVDDTHYALAVLNWFGVDPPRADMTLKFLHSKIERTSLQTAYHAVNALHILSGSLRFTHTSTRLSTWLRQEISNLISNITNSMEVGPQLSTHMSNEIYSIELPSKLELAYMIIDLSEKVGLKPFGEEITQEIARSILNNLKLESGPNFTAANISLAYYGLGVLRLLNCRFEDVKWVGESILKCEDQQGGFNITPHSRFRTLEYTYEATEALRWLGLTPRSPRNHARFILGCQNANGGFRRSLFSGISTLKDTFYAVGALRNLSLA